MKLPKFSKNKLSGAIFLLLIILLSQSNILDMLFNTTLGRLSLVSLILGAGYLNKFMGIAAVLIAIVMFSSFGNVFEGMETADPQPEKPAPNLGAVHLLKGLEETIDGEIEKKAKERKDAALNTDVATTSSTESFSNYDMIGKERTMQLGMKSKQANNSRQTGGNVTPFSFGNLFSSPLSFSNF